MTAYTAEEEVHHPLFARIYMRMASGRHQAEDEYRRRLLEGLSGRVIEVGAGNGLNFSLYPEKVERVLAVEPEPLLRKAAIDEAKNAPVEIEVVDGLASALPAGDGSQDAAIASLVLCSVTDQAKALAEMRRVLKPGGELRFYEHVVAHKALPARLQRVADATFWPRVAGGCHLARDTGAAIERAGFTILRSERFPFSPTAALPSIPHILGVARRP
ncbi:MAG: class I SAM-dependent methyltransferase [Solirubrobacterales bacterium]